MHKPLFFARCPLCSFYTWQGKHPQWDSSHCNVSAPYSSIALCVSSEAMVVAFDFASLTISLVGCQQHLILGPTTQTSKSWAEVVISSVGSYNSLVLCLDQPRTVLAWYTCLAWGLFRLRGGLRASYMSGVTDVSVKMNNSFQFPL